MVINKLQNNNFQIVDLKWEGGGGLRASLGPKKVKKDVTVLIGLTEEIHP